MKRTKMVDYQSCDLCDNPEETTVRCDICHKYLCNTHQQIYPWADQVYWFCAKHFHLVHSIIEQTKIPIGFVVYKLTATALNIYTERKFAEGGYSALWKDEWQRQV